MGCGDVLIVDPMVPDIGLLRKQLVSREQPPDAFRLLPERLSPWPTSEEARWEWLQSAVDFRSTERGRGITEVIYAELGSHASWIERIPPCLAELCATETRAGVRAISPREWSSAFAKSESMASRRSVDGTSDPAILLFTHRELAHPGRLDSGLQLARQCVRDPLFARCHVGVLVDNIIDRGRLVSLRAMLSIVDRDRIALIDRQTLFDPSKAILAMKVVLRGLAAIRLRQVAVALLEEAHGQAMRDLDVVAFGPILGNVPESVATAGFPELDFVCRRYALAVQTCVERATIRRAEIAHSQRSVKEIDIPFESPPLAILDLEHRTWYPNVDAINATQAPIAYGDVFKVALDIPPAKARYFVLVAIPSRTVESDDVGGDYQAGEPQCMLVEISDEPSDVPSAPLPYTRMDAVAPLLYVRMQSRLRVGEYLLDLCSLSTEGIAICDWDAAPPAHLGVRGLSMYNRTRRYVAKLLRWHRIDLRASGAPRVVHLHLPPSPLATVHAWATGRQLVFHCRRVMRIGPQAAAQVLFWTTQNASFSPRSDSR